MPVSSSAYFSVDTLQVHHINEAFLGGTTAMPLPLEALESVQEITWAGNIPCSIAIGLCVIFAMLVIPQLVEILPYLSEGCSRSKPLITLENNVRLSHERNTLAIVATLFFTIFCTRYRLLDFGFMAAWSEGLRLLGMLGAIFIYLTVRRILIFILEPKRRGKEYYITANHAFYNFLILLTALMTISLGICTLFDCNPLTINSVLKYNILAAAILFAIRKIELSSSHCNLFSSFLYLCALEIIPAGLLITAALYF